MWLRRSLGGLIGSGALFALLATAPALATATPHTPQKIGGPEISMLVRETILALHQANLTANYSVLHDLGDSRFQAVYSQSTLSDMFRGFRNLQVNLAPAVLYDAILDGPPRLTTDGLLRVTGYFPTTPQQIVFDLTFRSEGGVWRVDQINAGMRPAPPSTAAAVPAANPAPQPAQPTSIASAAPIPLAPPARRGALRTASGELPAPNFE